MDLPLKTVNYAVKRSPPAKKRTISPKRLRESREFIENPAFNDYNGQALVTLSYDDGLVNLFKECIPLHVKYKMPGSFNVIGGRTVDPAQWNKHFSPFQVKYCHALGFEIAAHSYYHDVGLPTKTDEEIHFECSETNRVLSELINTEISTMAIPYSQYDERVRGICSQYYRAVRVFSNLQNNIPPEDRHWIKSAIAVTNTTTFNSVKAVIDAAVTGKTWCMIMLHGVTPGTFGEYEITPKLLEQIMQYIVGLGKNAMLPVNTRDGIRIAINERY